MAWQDVESRPVLQRYVAHWPRGQDFGLVALAEDGVPVGAVGHARFPRMTRVMASSRRTSPRSPWPLSYLSADAASGVVCSKLSSPQHARRVGAPSASASKMATGWRS